MLVEGFAAPMFATNTWIIAPSQGSECLIFDAGMPDTCKEIEEIVERFKLKPVAIIATHGHLDHTFSIRPVANGYSIPAYIHSEDRILLKHPKRALSAEFAATLDEMDFVEPGDVRELRNGDAIEIVGMRVQAFHAPGHTRGSMIFTIDDEILVSGDVLFAGSIGRTDLPTGSAKDMEESLRNKIVPLDDVLRVLPGHGPETTIGHERRTNPYLKDFSKPSSKNKGRF
jgi:glyoxylase-like metal-dependent hydrolase (beta-lactamase superfamily II)